MRAVIIAHGEMTDYQEIRSLLSAGDFIIAADGGAYHAKKLGIVPHLLIGDMDSLGEDGLAEYFSQGVKVIRYPKEKDYTDTHLAILYAIEHNYQEIILLGALGTRIDHTLTNLFLMFHPDFNNVCIKLQNEFQEISVLKNPAELKGKAGEIFSLICLEDIKGLSIKGAKYPLNDADVFFGGSLTLSNEFLHETVKISWIEGEKILLVRLK